MKQLIQKQLTRIGFFSFLFLTIFSGLSSPSFSQFTTTAPKTLTTAPAPTTTTAPKVTTTTTVTVPKTTTTTTVQPTIQPTTTYKLPAFITPVTPAPVTSPVTIPTAPILPSTTITPQVTIPTLDQDQELLDELQDPFYNDDTHYHECGTTDGGEPIPPEEGIQTVSWIWKALFLNDAYADDDDPEPVIKGEPSSADLRVAIESLYRVVDKLEQDQVSKTPSGARALTVIQSLVSYLTDYAEGRINGPKIVLAELKRKDGGHNQGLYDAQKNIIYIQYKQTVKQLNSTRVWVATLVHEWDHFFNTKVVNGERKFVKADVGLEVDATITGNIYEGLAKNGQDDLIPASGQSTPDTQVWKGFQTGTDPVSQRAKKYAAVRSYSSDLADTLLNLLRQGKEKSARGTALLNYSKEGRALVTDAGYSSRAIDVLEQLSFRDKVRITDTAIYITGSDPTREEFYKKIFNLLRERYTLAPSVPFHPLFGAEKLRPDLIRINPFDDSIHLSGARLPASQPVATTPLSPAVPLAPIEEPPGELLTSTAPKLAPSPLPPGESIVPITDLPNAQPTPGPILPSGDQRPTPIQPGTISSPTDPLASSTIPRANPLSDSGQSSTTGSATGTPVAATPTSGGTSGGSSSGSIVPGTQTQTGDIGRSPEGREESVVATPPAEKNATLSTEAFFKGVQSGSINLGDPTQTSFVPKERTTEPDIVPQPDIERGSPAGEEDADAYFARLAAQKYAAFIAQELDLKPEEASAIRGGAVTTPKPDGQDPLSPTAPRGGSVIDPANPATSGGTVTFSGPDNSTVSLSDSLGGNIAGRDVSDVQQSLNQDLSRPEDATSSGSSTGSQTTVAPTQQTTTVTKTTISDGLRTFDQSLSFQLSKCAPLHEYFSLSSGVQNIAALPEVCRSTTCIDQDASGAPIGTSTCPAYICRFKGGACQLDLVTTPRSTSEYECKVAPTATCQTESQLATAFCTQEAQARQDSFNALKEKVELTIGSTLESKKVVCTEKAGVTLCPEGYHFGTCHLTSANDFGYSCIANQVTSPCLSGSRLVGSADLDSCCAF